MQHSLHEDEVLYEFMTMEFSQLYCITLALLIQQTEESIYQGGVNIDVSQKSPEQAKCVWLQQCCREENRIHGRNSIDR